jgi:hypothetical protein
MRATCPTHLILLDFTTRTVLCKEYKSLSFQLCNFLHSPVASSLLGPNTLLNTLFSNNLSLRSSLNVSDQVSHPYKATAKIISYETKYQDDTFYGASAAPTPEVRTFSVLELIMGRNAKFMKIRQSVTLNRQFQTHIMTP